MARHNYDTYKPFFVIHTKRDPKGFNKHRIGIKGCIVCPRVKYSLLGYDWGLDGNDVRGVEKLIQIYVDG